MSSCAKQTLEVPGSCIHRSCAVPISRWIIHPRYQGLARDGVSFVSSDGVRLRPSWARAPRQSDEIEGGHDESRVHLSHSKSRPEHLPRSAVCTPHITIQCLLPTFNVAYSVHSRSLRRALVRHTDRATCSLHTCPPEGAHRPPARNEVQA